MLENNKLWKQAANALGIHDLTEMQIEAIETYRSHEDILLISPTGSGKTLAFLLPLLESLTINAGFIQALIITPSRELAQQIETVFRSMKTPFKVNSCYGGHSIKTEKNNFISPPSVLVGTPGRITDHIRSGNILTGSIHTLILDEFDKSLEFGFQEEMAFIISRLGSLKKRFLCSATRLEDIPAFTGISNPFEINYLLKEEQFKGLIIKLVKSKNKDKLDSLFHLLCNLNGGSTLIFCNHRDAVERISKHLVDSGIINDFFHGGLEQSERERMLVRFRNGSSNILITTDLASRGIDIPDIQYIIHYQLPANKVAFIHRNGRTARMHSNGSSFLILSDEESIPEFINPSIEFFAIDGNKNLPEIPQWQTLYISGGKKEKINKTDVAGFLLKQGRLNKEDLGNIEIKDHYSYAAIKRDKIKLLCKKVQNLKIKNKKLKIEISY